MLGVMRKYKQSFIIKGVFTIIVLSFIGTIFLIWGKGDEGLKGSGYAIKVNGKTISYDEYSKAYERVKTSIQQMYGRPVTPELEKQFSLRKLTIENLINAELMRQEAKKQGLKVSDEEVIAEISKIPLFQKDGAFDSQLYQKALKMYRLTPSAFEEIERNDLLMKKMRKTVTDRAKVSDQEALQAYKKQHDRFSLQFVSFAPADVQKEIKVTDQELNAYLQKHQKEFKTQEEISLSYLILTPEKMVSKVSVSPEEVQTFFQKNIDRYQGKEGILPFEQVKDRAKEDALKFKAAKQAYEMASEAFNKNLKSGDLAAAARMMNVSVTETPLFSEKTPPASLAGEAALIKKAFTLKQGELGGPIETGKGVYLFTVKTRNPSAVPPLSKIRGAVEKQVVSEKAFDLARKKATDAQQRMAKGAIGGTMQETGSFQYSEKGDVPRIGKTGELMEAAVQLTKTNPAPPAPFYVNGRWYAVRLKERTEVPVAEFQKNRQKTIEVLLPIKQQEAVEQWLKGLKGKAKIVINPALTAD
jgi:peptidyl-prolyl cis-trans isomerase D